MDKGLLSRIDYIDKNFVRLFYIEEKYYEVAKTSQILDNVQLGEIKFIGSTPRQKRKSILLKRHI